MQATAPLVGFLVENNNNNNRNTTTTGVVVTTLYTNGIGPMWVKRFRGGSIKEQHQARDDHDTVPMLRQEEKEKTFDFERNAETVKKEQACENNPAGEAVKKLFESIILGDTEECVEICVSDDQTSLNESIAAFRSRSLSSDSQPQDYILSRTKSVSFAEPMVTSSWDIPKIEAEDVKKLFYTSMDYQKFRKDRNGKDMTNPKFRDKEYCEKLVQNLDRIGSDAFAKGEYHKALEAFKHSLQVKTETFTHHGIRSTSATVHCIADVYSKIGKWNRALDTYLAALELLSRIKTEDKDEDSRRWASILLQKVSIVQGYLDIVEAPSRESI